MSERFATVQVGSVGTLLIAANAAGVWLCDWLDGRHELSTGGVCERSNESLLGEGIVARGAIVSDGEAILRLAVEQLREYLDGRRRQFTVPLAPVGTAFQRQVWDALVRIPYSATATYGEVAAAIGRPTAVRAVARAIAANPLSILIPCHRVVPACGAVGGYAGGTAAKRLLLHLEQRAAL